MCKTVVFLGSVLHRAGTGRWIALKGKCVLPLRKCFAQISLLVPYQGGGHVSLREYRRIFETKSRDRTR